MVDRCLDDLVDHFRDMNIKEEEAALLKAIILLHPCLKGLSQEATEAVSDLRDRLLETLYHVARETHPQRGPLFIHFRDFLKTRFPPSHLFSREEILKMKNLLQVASSRLGNLLLFCPSILILGNVMRENLQFAQTFGSAKDVDTMMAEVLADIGPAISHPIAVDQVFPATPRSQVPHSEFSSSNSSLESQEIFSSYDFSRRHSLGGSYSSTPPSSSSSLVQQGERLNAAASMPNLEALETDPDYNVTLTADMFSGMRQAISVSQAMDMEPVSHQMHGSSLHSLQSPSNSTVLSNSVPGLVNEQRESQFFNELQITAGGSERQKFTVTTEKVGSSDQIDKRVLPMSGGVPITKTNSTSVTSSSSICMQPILQLEDTNCQHNSNSMDFEESNFY